MTPEELLQRLQQSEDNLVERKPGTDLREGRKTIVAFANSLALEQTACLFIGIGDRGQILGVADPDKVQKDVGDICDAQCYPPIRPRPRCHVLPIDGKEVRCGGNSRKHQPPPLLRTSIRAQRVYAPYIGNRIRKVSPSGIITTVAGGGQNFPGDGGRATDARLNSGQGLAVDGSGNLFLADNGRIRKISPDGIISTVAGNGGFDYSGDGGPATSAQLSSPNAVAVDGAGNLFIADGRRIRKVSPDGIITTVAGTSTCCFSSGDGGPATNAQLSPVSLAADGAGNVYVVDASANAVRILRPANQSVLIGAVVDAASQRADPLSPGKIVVIYGQFGTDLDGTAVSFNGIAAPVLYASATQVTAVVPYAVTGTTAQVKVTYQGQVSDAFTVPVAPSAPSLFASNQTGAGQAAAFNAVDGTANTAANPVKIGDSISLYATGEGQTAPAGVDGKLGGSVPTHPLLQVSVTVGGIPAPFQYAGGVEGQVAGLMQVKVQIPGGVQPGGYVPVVLRVGDASTTPGAVWIAVSGN